MLQAQALAQHRQQQVQAEAIARRNPDAFAARGIGNAILAVVADFAALDPVDLVEHQHLRQFAGADFVQHFIDLGNALLAMRIGGVDQVQQEVGLARFAQGRAERGHQLVRQVADETDGIGQHHVAARHRDATHGRVQGGEQLVGRIRLGAGQRVEQGRLAGIGVPHQRHARQFAAHAGAAHLGALHFDLFQSLLQLFDPLLQQAAVGFQLGFTRPAQADGTAALALQVGPAADQPRGHVAQLRQFHLQLAFVAVRTLGEDVQDQAGAVDHPALQELLQVALLRRRQGMVDQHQVGAGGLGGRLDLVQLAGADQDRRVGTVDPRGQGGRDAGPGRTGQVGEFLQHVFFQPAGVRLDQERVFASLGTVKHARLRSDLLHSTSSSSWAPSAPPSLDCT